MSTQSDARRQEPVTRPWTLAKHVPYQHPNPSFEPNKSGRAARRLRRGSQCCPRLRRVTRPGAAEANRFAARSAPRRWAGNWVNQAKAAAGHGSGGLSESEREEFYKWRNRPLTPRQVRRAELAEKIREFFDASGGTHGSPRITLDLWAAGYQVSENTVAKLMAQLGLAGRAPRRRRHLTRQGKRPA